MTRRVIVIFPDIPAASPIHELRRRFDPLAGIVPPHITLVFPFRSNLTAAQMRRHVQSAVRGISPFHIRLAQITASEGEYILLNVKQGNDQVIALHDRLYEGTLASFLSFEQTFVPHMTVGRLADEQTLREALAFTATVHINLAIVVTEVSVYTINDDGARAVESVIPLLPTPA